MNEPEQINEVLTISNILEFIKCYWVRGMVRGVLSLVGVGAIFVLCFFLLPKTEFYSRDIMLQLQKTIPRSTEIESTNPRSKTAVFCYPNLEPFVNTDLISIAVLKSVYEKNNLKDKVDFEDFSKAFAISDFNIEQAKIEAAYRAKLATKTIRIADIPDIEKTYRAELKSIPTDLLTVSAKKIPGLSSWEMAKIANEIPVEWYRIYSESEAKVLPQIPSPQLLDKLNNRYGRLAALEKMRTYISQFKNIIEEMNEQLSNRNVTLKSGETLGDLLTDIDHVAKFNLVVMKQMLLGTSALKSDFDLLFLGGREDEINRQLEKEDAKVAALVTALDIIVPKTVAAHQANSEKASAGTTQIMLDNSFMQNITSLIRNDANNSLRRVISQRMMLYKTEAAELAAEKSYFVKLKKDYNNTAAAKSNASDYDKLFAESMNELKTASKKIAEFKKLIAQDYAVERRFYITLDSVKVLQADLISPVRLAAGLLAVWVLLNSGLLALAFMKKYKM